MKAYEYDDVFERAKREIDLPSLLRSYGFELRQFNGYYRSNRCPYCGPSPHRNSTRLNIRYVDGTWLWHCFACGQTGDVVKAVQLLEGFYSAKDAAEWILEDMKPSFRGADCKSTPEPVRKSTDQKQQSETNRARLQVIKALVNVALTGKGSRRRIWSYLIEERCIPEAVVREALRRKILYMLPDSPVVANRVILEAVPPDLLAEADLLTRSGSVKGLILMRPVLSPFRKKKEGLIGAQFRAISPDVAPKTISLVSSGMWWWKGENRGVCVVEGLIDMLSLVAMRWKGSILALAGVGLAQKAAEVLKGPLKGMDIYIALDCDTAGREATEKIASTVNVKAVLTLPDGKDLNDLLKGGVKDWREIPTKGVTE